MRLVVLLPIIIAMAFSSVVLVVPVLLVFVFLVLELIIALPGLNATRRLNAATSTTTYYATLDVLITPGRAVFLRLTHQRAACAPLPLETSLGSAALLCA